MLGEPAVTRAARATPITPCEEEAMLGEPAVTRVVRIPATPCEEAAMLGETAVATTTTQRATAATATATSTTTIILVPTTCDKVEMLGETAVTTTTSSDKKDRRRSRLIIFNSLVSFNFEGGGLRAASTLHYLSWQRGPRSTGSCALYFCRPLCVVCGLSGHAQSELA